MEVSFWSQVPFKIKFENWLPTKNEKKEKKKNSSRNPDVWNVKDYKQFRKIMKSFMSDKSMFRYGLI